MWQNQRQRMRRLAGGQGLRWHVQSAITKTSNSHRRKEPEIKTLTLHFDSGTLSKIEGDWLPKSGDELLEESRDLQRNIPDDNRKVKNG